MSRIVTFFFPLAMALLQIYSVTRLRSIFFFFFPSKAQLSCLLSAYFLSGRVLVPLYVVQFHQDETRFWGTCWY